MGAAPPPDLPAPPAPGVAPSVGFAPGLPAASLCGFKFPPKLLFSFGFVLPSFAFPPKIPFPYLHLALNCDLSNPIDISAGLRYGGGRTPNALPDPDLDEAAP